MVVNNWFVTIDMYQAVTGSKMVPLTFFVTFWVCVTLVLLNVLLALIIEIYTSVEPEVDRKARQVHLTKQLSKIVRSDHAETRTDAFKDVRQ